MTLRLGHWAIGNTASVSNGVYELIAAEDGTLQATAKLLEGQDLDGLAVADFTHDGELDLVLQLAAP